VAPREPWERVWIDAEKYAEDIHALINCTECHAGQAVDDMAAAHEGLINRPSSDPVAACGDCHPTVAESAANSLHMTLAGYDDVLYARASEDYHAAIEEAQEYHCNDCHATCGDCHISQPFNTGGGLLQGHVFYREPSMSNNCTACHGSRVKNEYYGLNEGHPSDVHFRSRMACNDCHTGDQLHGVGVDAAHRYDGPARPDCIDCHEEQVGIGSGIYQHEIHGLESMSCQVCHSVSYTSCTNCHVEQTADGIPFYGTESHEMTFRIAKNVLRSNDRPFDYVTVRHVPIDRTSFSFYGIEFVNFEALPTWAYATPHNIQRNTPQTESCLSCHENDDVFLTEAAIVTGEIEANRSIIVDAAPPLPEGYENVITGQEGQPAPATDDAGSDAGGFWGAPDTATEEPPADDAGSFWGAGSTEEGESGESTGSADSFWGTTPDSEEGESSSSTDSESFWGSSD
jgi:hypothetical protein